MKNTQRRKRIELSAISRVSTFVTMSYIDNLRRSISASRSVWATAQTACLGLSILSVLIGSGCDRMVTPRNAQIVKDADAKSAQGDLLRAIGLYETALDGTARSADLQYKL